MDYHVGEPHCRGLIVEDAEDSLALREKVFDDPPFAKPVDIGPWGLRDDGEEWQGGFERTSPKFLDALCYLFIDFIRYHTRIVAQHAKNGYLYSQKGEFPKPPSPRAQKGIYKLCVYYI